MTDAPPDTTLRAVEIAATIGAVSRLKDGAYSLRLRTNLEFSHAAALPLVILADQPATILIQPDNIGTDADAPPVKPKGAKGGSPSQLQRYALEALASEMGIAPGTATDEFYKSQMATNLLYIQRRIHDAQIKNAT